jgi:hypothetical protein
MQLAQQLQPMLLPKNQQQQQQQQKATRAAVGAVCVKSSVDLCIKLQPFALKQAGYACDSGAVAPDCLPQQQQQQRGPRLPPRTPRGVPAAVDVQRQQQQAAALSLQLQRQLAFVGPQQQQQQQHVLLLWQSACRLMQLQQTFRQRRHQQVQQNQHQQQQLPQQLQLSGAAGAATALSQHRRQQQQEQIARLGLSSHAPRNSIYDRLHKLKPARLPTRKCLQYENCRIVSPEGVGLATCGMKKVRWYLERGLAELISEDPAVIKLKFTPKGRYVVIISQLVLIV